MAQITLDRREVLAKIFPDPDSYLFISGLAGSSRDAAGLTKDGAHLYSMAGAMGAAASTGLGVAMAAADRKVAVITGDGELLMNVGSLATIATIGPGNLSIVCIDNGCHGETGGQTGHTSNRTDLAMMAKGAGISSIMTVATASDLEAVAGFLAETPGPHFVLVKVKDGPPTVYRRNLDLAECRIRFRNGFQQSSPA
ncbi:MAG: thiamine pyrophosphate-binding protein [Rhodospirillales bacterium]|nr:thiamine pyrophosphate-binding protein [Rhodospirillales bacterium]